MTKPEIFNTVIRIILKATERDDFCSTVAELKIQDDISQEGMSTCGFGLYSVVVAHPMYPDRAFKVSTSRYDGYREYAKFCLERQGHSFIPNIYRMQVQGDYSWYELDLLEALDVYSEPTESPEIAKQQEAYYIAESVFDGDEASAWMKIDSETRCNDYQDMKCLVELCNEIRSTYIGLYEIDFHDSNAMIDSAGRFVLTDTLAKKHCVHIELTEDNPKL